MLIPDTWAPLLLSSVRDAIRYTEGFMRSETIRDKSDYEEHHLHLTQLLEYLKEEYRKIESEVGLPLEKISTSKTGTRFIPSEYRIVWDALMHYESYLESRASGAEGDDERLNFDGFLEDVDGTKKSLAAGAQNDFQLKLGQ